jgi:hypothetical protein
LGLAIAEMLVDRSIPSVRFTGVLSHGRRLEKPMLMRLPEHNCVFSLKNQAFRLARLYLLRYTARVLAQHNAITDRYFHLSRLWLVYPRAQL